MRRRKVVASFVAVASVTGVIALGGIDATDASWTTAETGSAAITAGTVNPPGALACNQPILQNPIFTWATPAAGGLAFSGYHWSLTNNATSVVAASGDVTAATVQPTPGGLLTTGTFTFTVVTNGPGTWTSAAAPTGTYRITIGLVTSCSVP